MPFSKRLYLKKMHNSPKPERGRRAMNTEIYGKMNQGKEKKVRELTASVSTSVSEIMRQFTEYWKTRRAGICLEDIL